MRAPPHTRGWTRYSWGLADEETGSPAHAGMDREVGHAVVPGVRLPRTRGDGPEEWAWQGMEGAAPPHTRGWTQPDVAGPDRRHGSPAHAGMDLSYPRDCTDVFGLPRTRGDGPNRPRPTLGLAAAPPHTRGWTRWRGLHHGLRGGSPAHAGMDPGARGFAPSRPGLPRTRGDGPVSASTLDETKGAPPHTRGWTVGPLLGDRHRTGSPAHAGMDPSRSRCAGRTSRLPRTRGDGPGSGYAAAYEGEAPPHTRGWTRPRRHGSRLGSGSPAHAGMDP